MVTELEVLHHAVRIKQFCQENKCLDCPFMDRSTPYECLFNQVVPENWSKEYFKMFRNEVENDLYKRKI